MAVRLVPFALVILATLPDAMSYPGLKKVVSLRFGQSDASTQLFTICALAGALLVIPFMGQIRRLSPRRVIVLTGILQAMVVGAMAASVPWWTLLVLRGVQGAFDLISLAVLTAMAARLNGGSGRTFGLLGSAIMAGLAMGFTSGGIISSIDPSMVFPIAAGFALLMGFAGIALPNVELDEGRPRLRLVGAIDRNLATGLALSASDRFLPGITTVVLPLLLAGALGMDDRAIGMVMAAPLLVAVIGGMLAGILVDRFGAVPIRAVGCANYGGGLLLLMIGHDVFPLVVVSTLLTGIGVTLIMPTALSIGTSRGRTSDDPAVAGWIQAGGQVGYIIGIIGGAGITLMMGGTTVSIIVLAVGVYLAWNAAWMAMLALRSSSMNEDDSGLSYEGSGGFRSMPRPAARPRPKFSTHHRSSNSTETEDKLD